MPPAASSADFDACAFLVGDHCFAVSSSLVAEVLHAGVLTPVPRALDAVAGLIHLRGQLVPVIDMRRRLNLGPSISAGSDLLVVRLGDDHYALLVDEVLDVNRIPADQIEPPSGSLLEPGTDPRTGVFAGDDRLVHLLDPQRIVHSLLRPRSSPAAKPPLHRHGASHVDID